MSSTSRVRSSQGAGTFTCPISFASLAPRAITLKPLRSLSGSVWKSTSNANRWVKSADSSISLWSGSAQEGSVTHTNWSL